MNKSRAESSFSHANLLWKGSTMFSSKLNLKSRLSRLGAAFLFGVIFAVGSIAYIASNPAAEAHVRKVSVFILLGSVVIAGLSLVLIFLALFTALAAEKMRRIALEEENYEAIKETGVVAQKVLVKNLYNPTFQVALFDAMGVKVRPSVGEIQPEKIDSKFFSAEIISEAVETLATVD